MIREKYRQKLTDVWVIEADETFSGFAITMNGDDLVLLDYFAICEEKRGQGLGGKSLRALQEQYRDKRFFLEVEFELLGHACEVSFEDYFSLYDTIYGNYASQFLEEI